MAVERPPLVPLIGLGLLNIVAFGAWFYGFGVLVEPVRTDTGWPESALTAAYGASLLATGVAGAVAGRVIDMRGGRALFGLAAVLAPLSLWGASLAGNPLAFAVLAVIGGGVTGAAGYYSATQAVISRIRPEARTESITALTLFGAFASPVALPAMGWAVVNVGWRTTLRWTAGAVAVAFLVAAAVSPGHVDDGAVEERDREGMLAAVRRTGAVPEVRRLYLAGLLIGASASVLLLYQVPAMVAAGLTLATASSLAGARGVVQLAGRVPLPPVVRRIGARRALRGSTVLVAVSALILPFAGDLPTGITFTAVAGVSIGALAALEGIYSAEVAEPDLLGTTLGAYGLVRGVGAAAGPVVAGLLTDVIGTRTLSLVLSAVIALAAAAMLRASDRQPVVADAT